MNAKKNNKDNIKKIAPRTIEQPKKTPQSIITLNNLSSAHRVVAQLVELQRDSKEQQQHRVLTSFENAGTSKQLHGTFQQRRAALAAFANLSLKTQKTHVGEVERKLAQLNIENKN